MKKLKNKQFLITGATSGIGKSITEALLQEGARGILIGRSRKILDEIRTGREESGKVLTLCKDLEDPDQIYDIPKFVRENNLEIDILIHSAGYFNLAPVADTTDEMLDKSYRVNFRAPAILTRELLENLSAQKGEILFINSTAADQPKAGIAAYAASKAALKSFAESLYQEVAPRGIRVSSIYPGRVATPMQQQVMKAEGKTYRPDDHMSPESVAELVVQLLTLPGDTEIRHLTLRPPLR